MRPSILDRKTMPRDELVALIVTGYWGYTAWRTIKGFISGLRGR
jgi:hypothetical protein